MIRSFIPRCQAYCRNIVIKNP